MAPAFEAAREYAALSGAFRPVDALPAGLPKDMVQVAAVASELAADCDPDPAGAGEGLWLMRAPARAHVLGQLRKEGRLDQAIAARTSRAIDPETDDLLAVLLDRSPFSLGEIRALLDTGQPRERLVRLVVALGRAGPDVRAAGLIDEARAVLAGIDQRARRERVEARSFVGRQEEQAQIAAWITQVAGGGPAQCLFVSGPPGIGKSSLLEKAVRSFRETGDGVVVRLDFDRAGLNTQDRLGLTMELARQVAERLPAASAELQLARRQAGSMASFSPDAAAGRTFTPRPLVAAIAAAVGSRPVLVVLDTLEVLRRGGDERGRELFDWLDDLTRAGLSRLRVLAAGRGDALDSSPERVRERRALEGLPDKDARELLTRLDAPQAAWEDILEVSQGNPLSLRLAAEIVRRHSGTRLPRRVRDAEGLTSALLYRFLLSRIEEPALRRLAHPGLVVRRLDAEILRVVVAPRVGVHGLTQARAETLLADLASQHWLVEPDPVAPGFIRHRADMRALLLPLLYRDSPKQCARIDAAAVQWFARGSEPWRQVEAAYHRVQLMRVNPGDRPVMAREIASELSDEETLRDLPPAGRDLVLELAGERTTRFRRGDAFVVPDDEGLASELAIVLRKQDWREGGEIIDRVARDGTLDPRGRAADMVRTLLWRSGRWGEARRWLRERDRLSPADEDLSSLPPEVALARLEMRAEFEPRAFVRAGAEARRTGASLRGAALESGNHLLREGAGAFLL
ncbi:MAG TPA: ATP-binding protein, partial [Phenylobacterium sp.]|nr:ATP-binding protein [Phenylobacterium sp.]